MHFKWKSILKSTLHHNPKYTLNKQILGRIYSSIWWILYANQYASFSRSTFFFNWNQSFLIISNILNFCLPLFLWKSLAGFYARCFFNLCLGLGLSLFFLYFWHLRLIPWKLATKRLICSAISLKKGWIHVFIHMCNYFSE